MEPGEVYRYPAPIQMPASLTLCQREVYHQIRLLPDHIRLRLLYPALTLLRKRDVEIIDNLGQNEAHLSVCQA